VVPAETVARQQLARQWTGWVEITWGPQKTRDNRRDVFSVCGPCREDMIQRSSVEESLTTRMERILGSQRRRIRLRLIVTEGASKSNHPIHNPLLLVTEP
jgi:hypothetical protein